MLSCEKLIQERNNLTVLDLLIFIRIKAQWNAVTPIEELRVDLGTRRVGGSLKKLEAMGVIGLYRQDHAEGSGDPCEPYPGYMTHRTAED